MEYYGELMKKPNHRISHLLQDVVDSMKEKESLCIQDIIGLLKERVFGLSILLFCIPNCLPIPNVAGLSAITGIPIIIIGLEMMAGRTHLWLPAMLGQRRIKGKMFAKFLTTSIPWMDRIEKFLHPRLHLLSGKHAQRALGLMFVILAALMSLPIPFGNFLPGFAMALMAIGLIERDGVMIMLGLLMSAATLVVLFMLGDEALTFIQDKLFFYL